MNEAIEKRCFHVHLINVEVIVSGNNKQFSKYH